MALRRHVRKLVRRGYVRAARRKGRVWHELVRDGKTPLHARLLAAVAAHWARR